MDSALRPRDIQARIRAGASPQDVAEAAGVPLERIDAFAAPVIAERDYIAGLARTNPVRRRGETTSHRTLRNAVADALAARGQDVDDANWDAWKLEDRRWQVRIGFEDADAPEGLFVFDALGRFSVAANDEGRALIGDGATDDLALVDATQGAAAEPEDEVADETAAEDEPVEDVVTVAPIAPAAPEVPDGQDPDAQQPDAERAEEPDAAASEPTPDADDDDSDDAFRDGALTEVDGVYDIVPAERGGLDVLYDMLSSFDEDSVTIYAGLVHPKDGHHETTGPIVVEDEEIVQDQEIVQDEEEMTGLVPRMEPITPPASEPDATPASDSQPETQQPADPAADEPEQLSLIEDVEEPAPRPKPRSRRKRASIPSWDEIMFGAPHAPNNDEK